jgi:hypothetical protein
MTTVSSDTGAPARPSAAPAAAAPAAGARRARLDVMRVDPWSVMKLSFVLSIAVAVIVLVATAVLWAILDAAGVFDSVDSTLTDVTGEKSSWTTGQYLSLSHVMAYAGVTAVIAIVLITALATLGAFLYNLATGVVGGVQLTLSEGR